MDSFVRGGAIGILLRGEEILVVVEQEDNPDTDKVRGARSVPGGWIEDGETPHDAAIREFLEEAGRSVIVIAEVGLIYVHEIEVWVFLVKLTSEETKDSPHLLSPHWMPVQEFLSLGKGQVRPFAQKALLRALSQYPIQIPIHVPP